MNRNPFFERMRRTSYLRALDRPELRVASVPRQAPAGPVSAPVKTIDPETRALIDAALATRGVAPAPEREIA